MDRQEVFPLLHTCIPGISTKRDQGYPFSSLCEQAPHMSLSFLVSALPGRQRTGIYCTGYSNTAGRQLFSFFRHASLPELTDANAVSYMQPAADEQNKLPF